VENIAGLMQRLIEIQSGERRRSPDLIAEDERLMEGLRGLAGKPAHQSADSDPPYEVALPRSTRRSS
jgi:hypothetical protein